LPKIVKKILLIATIIFTIAGTLSGIMTLVKNGYNDAFFAIWARTFVTSALVMAPMGGVFSWLVHLLVSRFAGQLPTLAKNLLFGAGMALLMESVMATSTTLNTIGLTDVDTMAHTWLVCFSVAFPFGLGFSILMSLVLKPKIEHILTS